LEGVRQWLADWERSWEDWGWDPEEFIEAGERVVAVLRVYAKAAAAASMSNVSTVRLSESARCGSSAYPFAC
jgi:hypothetical protein